MTSDGSVTTAVTTQSEARQFFIDKIVEQARIDRVTLSDDERTMLRWSESAEDSVADPDLPPRLAEAISDADYEAKIAGLVRRSFDRDVSNRPEAKAAWLHAQTVLAQGDHYLLIMINQAVGRRLKPWWKVW
jgi:hypothetical protein